MSSPVPSWSKCSGLVLASWTFPRTTFLGPNTFSSVKNTRLAKMLTQYETNISVQTIPPPAKTPNTFLLCLFFYSQCSPPSPITVSTEVTFVDTTVYPDPPRGAPQPQWKFPFGFFTRGTAELDGHTVFTSSGAEEVTWSLMLFTVMLLTGLEFFTR